MLYTGDLFIWAAPNAGNPKKCSATRASGRGLAGDGRPRRGGAAMRPRRPRIRPGARRASPARHRRLSPILARWNRGADERRGAARPPDRGSAPPRGNWRKKPYLQPIYDEPEFIVRNIHRCYGGWHNDVTARSQAGAARPAGARNRRARRRRRNPRQPRCGAGRRRRFSIGLPSARLGADAAPDSKEVHAVRADVYAQRARRESSTMARGIFRAAAQDSQKIAE